MNKKVKDSKIENFKESFYSTVKMGFNLSLEKDALKRELDNLYMLFEDIKNISSLNYDNK